MQLLIFSVVRYLVDNVAAHGADTTLKGWLSIPNKQNIKRHGYWKKQYVVVSKKKILFYDSEQRKEESNPSMVIDLE